MKRLLSFALMFLIYGTAVSAQNTKAINDKIICLKAPILIKKKTNKIRNGDCLHSLELIVDAKSKDINKLFTGSISNALVGKEFGRTDLWYNFIAPESGHVSIITNSDLGDAVCVFSGFCGNMKLISSSVYGHQTELKDLMPGNRYFIRVNVSLGVSEYEDCIMVKSIAKTPPYFENCIHAKKVMVGDICTSGNNMYNTFTGPRPSCVPYADANVWYSIEAPASGKLKLNSGADFYHVIAVYSGRCDKLEEIFCSKNPEKCNGFLEVKNLSPGTQYYVQIASAQGAFGYDFGNYCLEILDGSSEETYIPMKLDAGISCSGNGFGHINYTINGGKGNYTIEGNTVEDVLHTGQQYGITVKDEWGCEVSYYDRVECGAYDCQLSAETSKHDVKCYGEADGTASIRIKNESGNLKYEWSDGQLTKDITGLKAGSYTVTVTDGKYCELTETIEIKEPARFEADIDPIRNSATTQENYLSINTTGGTAPYHFEWEKEGELVSNSKDLKTILPGKYGVNIVDANGCHIQIRDIEIIKPDKQSSNDLFEWMVYPLPADKQFHIKLNSPNNESSSFSLIDSHGLIIKTIEAGSNNQEIVFPIQDVVSGVYLLQYKTGKHIDQRKVIIQR